ncbi:MAG: hypothetical protein AAF799_45485 [Myxococcota bacterium]
MPSRSRLRSRAGIASLAGLTLLSACGDANAPRQPVARVGSLVLEATVVEQLQQRDGLSEADARARGLETLRLVAAARAEQAARNEPPGLTERRAEHLRRSAQSRLWISEVFEPEHGPDDIPDDHPLLERARIDKMLIHPELYRVCQIVIEPREAADPDVLAAQIAEPAWQMAAMSALEPVLARVKRSVPVGDAEACKLMGQAVRLSGTLDDPSLTLKFPAAGGFDLNACAATDPTGKCVERRFHESWASVVRKTEPPGFSEPFFTPFGLHVVYVDGHMPGRSIADADTEAFLRETVVDAWRAQQFDQQLDALSKKRSVRMTRPAEDES